MKTRISRIVAALFFAILITGNVSATEHKIEASSHENTQEASLELENWMTDENIWNTSDFQFAVVPEATLEVENWMTSMNLWDVQSETLNLEYWMTNEDVWKVNDEIAFSETDLTIQDWMINENIWKI
uniref:hypothetical protein n=1 Tax=uncultured Draconibacterium sp. TaxID=1573823 RepID=UPI0032174222